jgi:2C-methyl-D-erythritol 2,4-cyclodiphosphate synthase
MFASSWHLQPIVLCAAGQLFPDNDPTWKGASSDIFVKEAVSSAHHCYYQLFLQVGG